MHVVVWVRILFPFQEWINNSAIAGDAKDTGLILGLGRSPGVGSENSLQYSYLENFMDRGGWQATFLVATAEHQHFIV